LIESNRRWLEVEEEEEGGEGGVLPGRPRQHGRAVAAHPARLPLLVLVVVAADPARVLPLPLPHGRSIREDRVD